MPDENADDGQNGEIERALDMAQEIIEASKVGAKPPGEAYTPADTHGEGAVGPYASPSCSVHGTDADGCMTAVVAALRADVHQCKTQAITALDLAKRAYAAAESLAVTLGNDNATSGLVQAYRHTAQSYALLSAALVNEAQHAKALADLVERAAARRCEEEGNEGTPA